MTRRTTDPRPLLREGALYWSDNGRVICAKCAGASALYTGRDISGQKVERITVDDVRVWPEDLGTLHCEQNCTALSAVAGPDGWPVAKAAVCPCWCEGRIADHDDRRQKRAPASAVLPRDGVSLQATQQMRQPAAAE